MKHRTRMLEFGRVYAGAFLLAALTMAGCGAGEDPSSQSAEGSALVVPTGTDAPVVVSKPRTWEPHSLADQRFLLDANPLSKKTPKLPEAPAGAPPPVYYVEVYVRDKHELRELEEMGVHYSNTPLFQSEWPAHAVVVPAAGDPEDGGGQFVFTLMPAAVYNAIIDAPTSHPLYRSMVVRVPPPEAIALDGSVRYEALAELVTAEDFAAPHLEAVDGELSAPAIEEIEDDAKQDKFLGRLLRKVVRTIAKATKGVIDEVRKGIGTVARAFAEETTLEVTATAGNLAEGFAVGSTIKQAWGPDFDRDLVFANTRIDVKQLSGFALYNRRTDDQGRASLRIMRNKTTRVCLQLDADAAHFEAGVIFPVQVCEAPFRPRDRDRQAHPIIFAQEHASALAQFIDSRKYAREVLGFTPKKAEVQVGWLANLLSSDKRAFVPCLAATNAPNAVVDTLANGLNIVLGAGSWLEFALGVDVVLPDGNGVGRVTATHEYGHYFLCTLMAATSDSAYSSIWSQAVGAALLNEEDSEISAMNEGFADFFAAQVAGGTNYYGEQPNGGQGRYANGDFLFNTTASSEGRGVEANIGTHACGSTNAQPAPECQPFEIPSVRTRKIASVTTLLHDIIDRAGCTGDCTHTISDVSVYDGSPITLQRGTPLQTDDEQIAAGPERITSMYRRIASEQLSDVDLFTRATLYEYLYSEFDEYADDQLCRLISLHSTDWTCKPRKADEPAPTPPTNWPSFSVVYKLVPRLDTSALPAKLTAEPLSSQVTCTPDTCTVPPGEGVRLRLEDPAIWVQEIRCTNQTTGQEIVADNTSATAPFVTTLELTGVGANWYCEGAVIELL